MRDARNKMRDIIGLSLFIAASKIMQPVTLVRLMDKVNASLVEIRS